MTVDGFDGMEKSVSCAPHSFSTREATLNEDSATNLFDVDKDW